MSSRRFFITALLVFLPHVAAAEMQCDFLSKNYFSRNGSTEDVVKCLERGYTLAIQDTENGDTPLHLAAGHLDDPFLLDQIALLVSPDELLEELVISPNSRGMNPFHVAVEAGRSSHFLASLARWGDPINSVFDEDESAVFRKRGSTALHLAMQDWNSSPEQVDRVLTLLALGADPQLRDRVGDTPLELVGSEDYVASLILNEAAWRKNVQSMLDSASDLSRSISGRCQSEVIEKSSTIPADLAWSCLDSLLSARSDPASFWDLLEGGDNFLHRLVKSSPNPFVLDAVLGAADNHGVIEEALSSENIEGFSAIHLASASSNNPLTIVQLVRWGADVNRLARPTNNGFLKADTGISPLHVAARREPLSASTPAITALLAFGANASVYDNNMTENAFEERLGLQPIDYMNKKQNFGAMALIGPGFSFCEKVDEYKGTATAALGLGGGVATASGGATIASTAAGVTAVTHSSGAIILTGSSGYIAGTLGTFATSAFATLAAPATLTAAGAVVVLTGGSVLYCSATE
ncbi:MAG: hypothetical protein V2I45_04810 [Halieaceae bacterium]|jgi:ankyrin repeat protein|nr:hypothetical protein [Halieaceae bacterium]